MHPLTAHSTATLLTLLASIGLAPSTSMAFPDGRADGATDCAPCHGNSPTSSVAVSISGSSTLMPNETGTYTLTIGTDLAGGALNVAIISGMGGTLGVVDANTKLLAGPTGEELVHADAFSNAPTGNIGDWVYNFTVTAPGTIGATITLAAVGMQFDNSFDQSGDFWNSPALPFGITVVPEPGTGLLLAGGLVAMGVRRRLRRGSQA